MSPSLVPRWHHSRLWMRLFLQLGLALAALAGLSALAAGQFLSQVSDRDNRLFFLETDSFYAEFFSRLSQARHLSEELETLNPDQDLCRFVLTHLSGPDVGAVLLDQDGAILCAQGALTLVFPQVLALNSVDEPKLFVNGTSVWMGTAWGEGAESRRFLMTLGALPLPPTVWAERILLISPEETLYDSLGAEPALKSLQDLVTRNKEDHRIAVLQDLGGDVRIVALQSKAQENLLKLKVYSGIALIFCAALLLCCLIVNGLVGRYVGDLGFRVRRFGDQRVFTPGRNKPKVAELKFIETEFRRLLSSFSDTDIQAQMQLSERKFLLKELHHRVHNNLQTISSLISLAIRKAHNPHERQSLSKVQDKVLTLASIHRALLQSDPSGLVSANLLLREVVGQRMNLLEGGEGASFALDVEPLGLDPDQAVPFALFVVEAIGRAFAATQDIETAFGVRLFYYRSSEQEVTLLIENTTLNGEIGATPLDPMTRGLLQAYAAQLGGRLEVGEVKESFARHDTLPKIAQIGGFWQVKLTFHYEERKRSPVDF